MNNSGIKSYHSSLLSLILAYLFTDCSCHCDWEGPDISSTQILTFPLVAEELQLPFFFFIQRVTISNLNKVQGIKEVSHVP